jgi:hypothetical protein
MYIHTYQVVGGDAPSSETTVEPLFGEVELLLTRLPRGERGD